MMQTQILAMLFLSLAIACSWSRFRTIFSQATDNTILMSPATTLASTVCLSASALAFVGNDMLTGIVTIALGLAFAVLLGNGQAGASVRVAMAACSLLAYAVLSATH
ncbi:hypothetical protein [Pararhizobium sp. O133]|uniref:hypothetical protein n=1 Tax=Pararhizobium sp. O133 TaxID=3449278 RepID=UPI003F687BD5